MENNNFENTTNMMANNESKKKGNKGLIIFLVIIILGMGGYIAYDKVLKDKIFTKDENKTIETKKDKDNNKKEEKKPEYEDQDGVIKTDSNSSATLVVNGKNVQLVYKYLEDTSTITEVGTDVVTVNGKEIYKEPAINGIGDISYHVFTATDGNQYALITYYQFGMFGILLDENGTILENIEEWDDSIECFLIAKDEKDLITIKDGEIYYYTYKQSSMKEEETLDGNDGTALLKENKITINNGKISKSITGKEIDGFFGQCSN